MSEPFYIENGPVLYVENPWEPESFVTMPNFMESIPAVVSFHDFLHWNYTDEYYSTIKECVESGSVSLGRYLDTERASIQNIRLSTAKIHKVYLHRISMKLFRLDVVVIAEFTAHFYSGYKYQQTQWYRVQGEYIADGRSNFFQAVSVYQKDDIPDENPLSEYLVPYLSKHALDAEAGAMLNEYYPEALLSSMPIDAKELARRMGYKVKVARLSDDDSKLGAVFMKKAKVTYYKNGVKKQAWISEKTILIDTEACKNQNRKAEDVIVHECIHVYEHYLFYYLQKVYRDHYEMELPGFEDVVDDTLGTQQLNWIENQANHMTSRVRMPLCQAAIKAAEFFEEYSRYPESVAYSHVIDRMAEFFRTSKSAAANRLVEIGYDKARGMLKYANGKPVPGYLVEPGIPYNKTYTIDFDKVVDEFDRNAEFRRLLDKGAYIYVEGHLCRNTKKYIWFRNNHPVLSPYARTHMAECCLLFTIRHGGTDYEYIPGALNLNVKKSGKLAFLYDAKNVDEIEASIILLDQCPDTFAQTLKFHMNNLGFSCTSLSEVSMLSERTIARMRSDRTQKMPAMESIILAGIGMKIYPELIPDTLSQLIRTAFVPKPGYKFIVADFSAIEARVIAWLAGETWRMEAFARGDDIYCASASRIFGVPVVKHGENGHLRQKGKVAELACGYGGSVGAMKAMGGAEMSDAELKQIVTDWRNASPHIVQLWWDVESAAVKAVSGKTEAETHGIKFSYESGFLFIELPSHRRLAYVKPKIEENRFGGDSITYFGIGASKKWQRLETYSGKLVENIVQAIARDLLFFSMQTLSHCFIVGHIHDEMIIECSQKVSLEVICEQMARTPAWADGLLLRADGYECDFYKKD